MASIVTLGEAMMTFSVAGVTPLRHGSTASVSMSGSEATVAIGARRLGHEAVWISRLGSDEPGEMVRSRMLGEGVAVYADRASEPTGLMLKEHPRAHARRVQYYRAGSAAAGITANDLPVNVIENADILHSSGITAALGESAAATLIEAIRRARASKTLVSFDVNHRSKLWSAEQARATMLPLLSSIDVLFASHDEAQLLLESASDDPVALGTELRRLGPSGVVITRGAHGAWLVDDSGAFFAEPVATTEIDPFGAGDAFVAGYLSTLLDGGCPARALARASLAASLAVSSEGDWEALPDRAEVEARGLRPATAVPTAGAGTGTGAGVGVGPGAGSAGAAVNAMSAIELGAIAR
ncbi:MAG: ribokinaselike protein [Subtercola sp.]|nr:ribokinaselike protein [Subtercola sp.]